MNHQTTIGAIATPKGAGGIAIIRISGPAAIEIVSRFFRGKVNLLNARTWQAYLGKFAIDSKQSDINFKIYDHVIVTIFRAPKSYTKEDTIEISCHGGILIAEKILDTLVKAGVHPASPGEFTFRAFMNGRIDLSRAEAVADLIKSKSELELKNSLRQMEGILEKIITRLRSKLLKLVSLLELELDFSEEDVEFAKRSDSISLIDKVSGEIEDIIRTYDRTKLIRDGIKVVLFGKPNVGKSSILNALLKENRAIVTSIPGTTRDILEEQVHINGFPVRLIDTAGITESQNPIEQEGVRRSIHQLESANIVLFVIDSHLRLSPDDAKAIEILKQHELVENLILTINKIDLNSNFDLTQITKEFPGLVFHEMSALTGKGVAELGHRITSMNCLKTDFPVNEFILTNLRHKKLLESALSEIEQAKMSIENNLSNEFIVSDLRIALDYLGEITGIISPEDILNNIFGKFCIGK